MRVETEKIKWDGEAGVIVAGFGGAGACAAIAAHDAGAKVLIIEKAPFGGGNTSYAQGPMRLPNNVEEAVKYYRALSFGTVNDEHLILALVRAMISLPEKLKPLGLTIAHYNEQCATGKADTFGRPSETMTPIQKPPFYAAELCLAIVNTQGGPKHNSLAQTIDLEGNPIPRLYTPGELGSFFGHLYQGGSNLPEALAFGLIAGEQAAKETPW